MDDLRGVLSRNPERAREALEALLVDKLTFRPVETPDGKRYEVTENLAVGGLLRLPGSREIASPGRTDHPGSIENAAVFAADAVRVALWYVA